MPIWSEILGELSATAERERPPAFDPVRRKYLADLHEFTGRNTILYASAWIQKPEVHNSLKSHARHIPRDDLKRQGMVVRDLESDDNFQDLTLSVFHATTHTFMGTSAVKIVENHWGRAFVKQSVVQPPHLGAGLAHLG